MKRYWEDDQIEFRAKRTKQCPGQPLPVPLTSITGQPPSNFVWKCYNGRLKIDTEINNAGRKHYIVVSDQEHVQAIYTHGFFGTIVFNSASVETEYETKSWHPGLEFEAAKKEIDNKWEEKDDFWNTDKEDDTEKEKETEQEKGIHEDYDKADDKIAGDGPQNWSEVASFNQKVSLKDVSLHLELCEAFYLSFAIGCLVVSCDEGDGYDGGQEMTLIQMWKKYCKLEQDFPYRYAAYQHFRSRGWITRSGYTMGSDWLLYKLGPPFYHATFTVIVEAVSGETGQILPKPDLAHPLTWTQILALNRLNENVNKNLLLARVEEHNLQPSDFESPFLISRLAVSLKRVKRWQPAEMRWDEKPEVPVQPKANRN